MRQTLARLRLFVTLATLLLLLLALATARPAAAQPADSACIALVLDDSGSMRDSDPGYLRNTGARLFITLLDDGDRVGIIRFSSGVTNVSDGLVTLNTPADRLRLLDALSDRAPEGYTDLRAGLQRAADWLGAADCPVRHIVLLSDGYPQLDQPLPDEYIPATVAVAQELNAPVYAIALTAGAESDVLYELARATNPAGSVIPARAATDLLDAYLSVVAQLKDRTVIGSGAVSAPAAVDLPLPAELALYVNRVTYVAGLSSGAAMTLVAPDGRALAADAPAVHFAYTADGRFAVYTLDNPAPGTYRVEVAGGGSAQVRAILRSRLRLQPQLPPFHAQGTPLPVAAAMIEELADGSTSTLIGTATLSAEIVRPDGSRDVLEALSDNGTGGDRVAGDGRLTADYVNTDLPGEYQIVLTGYKGVVPVTFQTRVLVVPFPALELVEPAVSSVQLRAEPVALHARLSGGEPPTLDSGDIIALVSAPSGRSQEIVLTAAGSDYSGSFVPAENGTYTLRVAARDAWYKGVPYVQSVGSELAVTLIPSLAAGVTALDAGTVELYALDQNGVTVELPVNSSSTGSEPLTVEVVGLDGLTVHSVQPATVPAGQSSVFVTLRGTLAAGAHSGRLLLGSRDGIDMPQREVALTLRAYQPAIAAAPADLDFGRLRADRQSDGLSATLTLTSQSEQTEQVQVSWRGPDGSALALTEPVMLPAGETVSVPLALALEALPEGTHDGELRLSVRAGVQLSPAALPAGFVIVPLTWCDRYCRPLLLLGGALGVAAVGMVAYLNSRPRPWGTLEPSRVPPGQLRPETTVVTSSFLRPGRATLGSGRGDNVRLAGDGIRPRHAEIRVAKHTSSAQIGRSHESVDVTELVNVLVNTSGGADVRVNGTPVLPGLPSEPLTNGTRIELGGYEFRYLL